MSDYFVKTEAKRWLYLMTRVRDADALNTMAEDLRSAMAQKDQPAPGEPKRNGYREIAESLGMPWMASTDLMSIKSYAEDLVINLDRSKSIIREMGNESAQDKESLSYHQACLKQLRDAIGTDPSITPARLVEMIIERLKHDAALVGKLDQMMTASHFADSDGIPTILSVLQYRKRMTEAAEALLPAGYDGEPAAELAKLEAENLRMKVKLQRIEKEVNGVPTMSASDTIHLIRGVLAND